jgi:hypothetical protein
MEDTMSSAHRSHDSRVQPFRLVSIDARRHVPRDPTRTRIGVGDQFIDHAAGKPLNARQTSPRIAATEGAPRYVHGVRDSQDGRHYVIAPVSPDDWEDQPNLHDGQRLRDVLDANEAPVELPLRPRARMYLVVAGLLVAFIAMLAGTFFAGATSRVRDVPAVEAAE